jgi:two-component system alkaline phosphatase synthesis response regulator PhoP
MPKIMIVDDERHIVETLSLAFEKRGYQVVGVSDATQCVPLADREKPDAIILDIMMPGMDGYEVFTRLGEDEGVARIPVVVLTAKPDAIYRRISEGLGAGLHLTKPFKPYAVVEQVERMLGRAPVTDGEPVVNRGAGTGVS